MWIRCLGCERLPTASYLCSSLKPEQTFFSPGSSSERIGIAVVFVCFVHTSRRHTFDLDTEYPRSTRFVSGTASEYRWRPLKFVRIHGLGGKRFLVMSYALCPNPKNAYFLPSEMDRDFLSSVSYKPAVKCFFLRRLAGARHISPAFV